MKHNNFAYMQLFILLCNNNVIINVDINLTGFKSK